MKAPYSDGQEFSGDNFICRIGPGGLPVLEIDNKYGHARISLLGANVIDWIPRGAEPVIWLSKDALFKLGKSIRGGIPICWPWFGAHPDKADYPAHGFARSRLWNIDTIYTLDTGETRVEFFLKPDEATQTYWPCDTQLEYHVTVGKSLQLELITTNQCDETRQLKLTQALHTYFKVGDVSKVTVRGLEDKHYLDKLEGFAEKEQTGPISIQQEVDRIYLDTTDECIIEDPVLKRHISIKKTGSHSTVVWNPWQATAEKMGDLGNEGYKTMLCVESSNAAGDTITLEQGEQHRLSVTYEVTDN